MGKKNNNQEATRTQEEEIFVPIKGYEGLYSVSNMGRIRTEEKTRFLENRKITSKSRIIKPKTDKYGNLSVRLSCKGQKKDFFVHRLVAEHFVEGQTKEKKRVFHINGIKTDNRASNLRWEGNYTKMLENEKMLLTEDNSKTMLTNLQLARWLACGNGLMLDEFEMITTCYIYMNKNGTMDDKPCRNTLVRKWGDTGWHEPTHEYCYGKTAAEGV